MRYTASFYMLFIVFLYGILYVLIYGIEYKFIQYFLWHYNLRFFNIFDSYLFCFLPTSPYLMTLMLHTPLKWLVFQANGDKTNGKNGLFSKVMGTKPMVKMACFPS